MRNFIFVFLLLPCIQVFSQPKPSGREQALPLKLWYSSPAKYFEETLLIGNGMQGATIYGGVTHDRICLNDLTLWSGGPVDSNQNREAYRFLPLVRQKLQEENYEEANKLIKNIQGKFSESYAPMGDILLHFNGNDSSNYYRELNIEKAVARINQGMQEQEITREYIYSNPHQILGIHIKSKKTGGINFDLTFASLLLYKTSSDGKSLTATGVAPQKAEPNYTSNKKDPVVFDWNRGTRFTTKIQLQSRDGSIRYSDSVINVSKATDLIIWVASATSFNGYDKDPTVEGRDPNKKVDEILSGVSAITWDQFQSKHINDYRQYFSRVKLELQNDAPVDIPTDERLKRYAKGESDPYLETLYFQYGRYLLISSSRTSSVPANLQGLWNSYLQPPWSSNYTLNINAEENYWLAENTNLSEMHLPFLQFIKGLSQTGATTARHFYNLPGWVSHHNSDIWAMSNPVGDFGKGDPSWANWPMGGAWTSTHLWEHYSFIKDEKYLREYAYPIMKGAANFCLAFLVKDTAGHYITSPSTSPENYYKMPDGYKGPTLYGGTADLAMIRELFIDVIKAQKILKNDNAFEKEISDALKNLHPYMIGKIGNLQEWFYDWEDAEPQHRHQSHLFGLYPGTHITPEKNPDLTKAIRKTLDIKGDETTGWSKGWRINLWARLKDGDRAYKMYRELLKYVPPDGTKLNYSNGGGTYPNLLDAHPPFQIDGNFGGAAAVSEMLLQSSDEQIELLPALPSKWVKGHVSGLKARGNYTIEIDWNDGLVKSFVIGHTNKQKVNVRVNGKVIQVITNTKTQL